MATEETVAGVEFMSAGLPRAVPQIQVVGDDLSLRSEVKRLSLQVDILSKRCESLLNFVNGLSFSPDFGGEVGPSGGQIMLTKAAGSTGIKASGTQDLYKIVQLREEELVDGEWVLVAAGQEVGGYDSTEPTRRLRPYWDYIRARRTYAS